MSEQRVPFSVREEAMSGLRDWWAVRLDTWFANQIAGYTVQADTRYTGNSGHDRARPRAAPDPGADRGKRDQHQRHVHARLIDRA
jgi:hypothetical protein